MMIQHKKLLLLSAAAVFSICLLAGCSENSSAVGEDTSDLQSDIYEDSYSYIDSYEDSDTYEDTDTEDDLAETEAIFVDTVYEVTAVNDDGTLELCLYEIFDETQTVTDYASLDLNNYTQTEYSENYSLEEDIIVFFAEDSQLIEASADDICAGDFLVFCTDDYGDTNIVIYRASDN